MSSETFTSVWDALEDTPEQAESMKARAALMHGLIRAVGAWKLTQAEAAKRLGVTQPRLNDLLRGRIQKFSLDALVDLGAKADFRVQVKLLKKVA